jgi:RimJ/RimL family protein N-acetyltransferase
MPPYGIAASTTMTRFSPPLLSDGFVTLRPWHDDDAEALVRRINDPEVARFLDQVPQPYALAHAREYLDLCREGWRTGATTNFAVLVDDVEGPAGSIGVHWDDRANGAAEVGYWIAAEARGRDAATRALLLISRWAFEATPDLFRLQLRAEAGNPASNRVAEKAGFTREGVLRSQRLNVRLGRRVDFVHWSLLREEV